MGRLTPNATFMASAPRVQDRHVQRLEVVKVSRKITDTLATALAILMFKPKTIYANANQILHLNSIAVHIIAQIGAWAAAVVAVLHLVLFQATKKNIADTALSAVLIQILNIQMFLIH